MNIPTVRIVAPQKAQGWKWINEADFDPKAHKLYSEDAPKRAPRKAKEV